MRWIIDQGGKFYDEKTFKWTWQTAEAERAFQWILDLYDKHGVAWQQARRTASKTPWARQRAAMIIHGAYALSGYVKPLPRRTPSWSTSPCRLRPRQGAQLLRARVSAGYALSALLKPDDTKARIGAAFYSDLLSPDWARRPGQRVQRGHPGQGRLRRPALQGHHVRRRAGQAPRADHLQDGA